MDSDIPYRTPFLTPTPAASVSSTDENEFSTLLQVRNNFYDELTALKDFNTFVIDKDRTPTVNAKILLHDIEVNQAVYAILFPLFEALDGTVNDINSKYREKFNNGR